MDEMQSWINESIPEAYVLNAEIGDGWFDSIFGNMWEWLTDFIEVVGSDEYITNYGSFDLICHSQGNLFCRGYIAFRNSSIMQEKLPNADLTSFPVVHNYISLSAPAAGFFGDDGILNFAGVETNDVVKLVGSVAYPKSIQNIVNPCGYWKDPFHTDVHLELSSFITYLNNEISHPDAVLNKQNMLTLNFMKLIGSQSDSVIAPWQSAWFGFYKDGTNTVIENADERDVWESLGLGELNDSGRLAFVDSGLEHSCYLQEACGGKEFFNSEILPLLGS
ncbi:Lysosomal thioesterase PPT2 like protein [Aduncisulcus paluster]|uniref:Lysosomal thioesterase PPT2 like protein n=1 Tax=Aduncisulcus paluster TaxID=2918883 RepID=A0ABQ5K5Z4_9EUKA|nr:Lysosomal thioesterase PPT2 like protein [Aduncisulcus paluster]